MTLSYSLSLLAVIVATAVPSRLPAQSISTSRTLAEIGPVGDQCRVQTCIEADATRSSLCVVQVLDNSGSMNSGGRFGAALAGIGQFIDSLDADKDDRVGVVTFSGPELRFGPTPQENPGPPLINVLGDPPIGGYATLKEFLALVVTLPASFLTPLSAAIEKATIALSHCSANGLRVMIVSTDGLPNWDEGVQCTVTPLSSTSCTDAALAAASKAKADGIHVVTIGIDLNPSDPSDAFGISLLRDIATSPQDANFFNTADGLGQSDIFSHLEGRVASPAEVTFLEPLPDSCWTYVPATTTGTTTDDPAPGLIGTTPTLAWNVGIVPDGDLAQVCYAIAFNDACGEPPSRLTIQSGGEVLWQRTDESRISKPIESTALGPIEQCQIVFPVELVDFHATSSKSDVTLTWLTASETDNAGFGIERVSAGGSFEEIGFIRGSGTSLVPIAYRFVDRELTPGRYRYRLRQVDFDGSFAYSPTVEAKIELPTSHFMSAVYPNPMRGHGAFDLSVARQQLVEVELVDMAGRLAKTISSRSVSAAATQTVLMDVRSVAAGAYVIRVRGEYFTAVKLVLVAP